LGFLIGPSQIGQGKNNLDQFNIYDTCPLRELNDCKVNCNYFNLFRLIQLRLSSVQHKRYFEQRLITLNPSDFCIEKHSSKWAAGTGKKNWHCDILFFYNTYCECDMKTI